MEKSANALGSLFRGEDTVTAEVGALLIAETVAIIRGFALAYAKKPGT